jgi:hypothetical protein
VGSQLDAAAAQVATTQGLGEALGSVAVGVVGALATVLLVGGLVGVASERTRLAICVGVAGFVLVCGSGALAQRVFGDPDAPADGDRPPLATRRARRLVFADSHAPTPRRRAPA